MPGESGCNRGDHARVLCFISHARLRVQRAPGMPHALYRAEVHAQLGRIRAAGMWWCALSCLKIECGACGSPPPGAESVRTTSRAD
jgi:hypothetical protein